MKLILKNKKIWALVLLGVVLLYPFESEVVPAQNVLVVTEGWNPIQGILIRQSWQNYSVEGRGHEEDKLTDENGRVSFPRRTIRASLFWRASGPVVNIIRQGVHAGFGVHTNVIALGDGTIRPDKKVVAQPGDMVFGLR